MKSISRVAVIAILFAALAALPAAAQIETAQQYFDKVSAKYASVDDYEGTLSITTGSRGTWTGSVIYKAPSLLRVDFSNPASMVISFDGSKLIIYVPEMAAILNQDVTSGSGAAVMGSKEGLKIMRSRYSITYLSNPNPEPLEAGSSTMVVKFKMLRRSPAEGFTQLIVSIDPETLLIRRIEGNAITGEKVVFDFTGIKLNVGIGDMRFMYDAPNANVFNNFLFSEN